MDVFSQLPPLWLISVLVSLMILYKVVQPLRDYMYLGKIPGPKGFRFIGNADLVFRTPVELFAILNTVFTKIYYPIFKVRFGITCLVIILSPDDTEMIISQMKHLKKGTVYIPLHDWLKEGLLLSDGAKWQHRRKLLTPTFHFSILNQFTKIFIDESNKLVRNLKPMSGEPVDVFSVIAKFTLHSICETAMGTKLEEIKAGEKYKESVAMVSHLVVDRVTSPWQHNSFLHKLTLNYWRSRSLLRYLHSFTANVIKRRQVSFNLAEVQLQENNFNTKKRLAMLDLLLLAKLKGDAIDDEGIQEEVDTFMFEAHDTTATSLTFSLMLLACHIDVQEKICEELEFILNGSKRTFTMEDLNEMKYLERVIKESLRLYPSVANIARELSEDIVTSSGYYIPKGTTVNVAIYCIHHNPMYYKDPEKFDPNRFIPENTKGKHPYAYIPFSAGPRNCIGQKFAMLEMKAAIATILRNFELRPIDTPETVKLQPDIILRSTQPILVKFVDRQENCF